MNLDSTTTWIIIAVVALLALYFYNRSRPAPRGTYDDKNVRSSGSIGGGTRAHDDPAHRSSGSIGGGTRGYDAPDHESSGSIGGSTKSSTSRESVLDRDTPRDLDRGIDRDGPLDRLADERTHDSNSPTRDHTGSERQHDDDRFKSKGSIGG